jgi:hypothetical protein
MPRPDRSPTTRTFLRAEPLEPRDTPAVTVQIDYRLDTLGFFGDPARRTALETAVGSIAPRLQDSLSPITPSGQLNTWQVLFTNPSTGEQRLIPNQVIPADTIVLYALGAPLAGSELGEASTGLTQAQGTSTFLNQVFGRGQPGARNNPATDYAPWGGFITFDTLTNWSFSNNPPGIDQIDFLSVAEHEFFHLLGFSDGIEAFDRNVAGGSFVGPSVTAVAGGPVGLTREGSHWARGTLFNGQMPTMLPSIAAGEVQRVLPLDFAALQDIGWQVGAGTGTTVPPTPITEVPITPTPVLTPAVSDPLWNTAGSMLAVGADGDDQGALLDANLAARTTATPSGVGFTGGVRVASADVNGDGTADLIAGSGPGGPSRIVVVDGRTGAVLFTDTPFEDAFTGGVYVAAGDIDGDGRADVVVTPDRGGGPRVRVYRGRGFTVMADFFGINDPDFRGGARAAVGDVDGDGFADVVVSAGFLGGPRIAGFRGAALANGSPSNLFPDFFAFEQGLRNGAFVAVGDVNGDRKAELVFGGGPGGGPRVKVVDGAGLLAAGPIADLDARTDLIVSNFFAGNPDSRGGIRVAVKDFDRDGLADVVAGAGDESGTRVTAYYGLTLRAGNTAEAFRFEAFPGAVGGVYDG